MLACGEDEGLDAAEAQLGDDRAQLYRLRPRAVHYGERHANDYNAIGSIYATIGRR